jgi:hypothetical protein
MNVRIAGGSKGAWLMRILALTLLIALAAAPAAQAHEQLLLWNLKIIYARGAGIKSFVDEREKHEKARNRVGTGLLIFGDVPAVPPVPQKKR